MKTKKLYDIVYYAYLMVTALCIYAKWMASEAWALYFKKGGKDA